MAIMIAPRTSVTSQTVINALTWRYATKHFDPYKELSEEEWETLEQTLIQSPSSFGLQPWRFIVVKNMALRSLLRWASHQIQSQVTECSHYVVFAAKTQITEKDVDKHIEHIANIRGVAHCTLESYKKMMMHDIVKGIPALKHFEWSARQCYLALGNLIAMAAMMGIDTCPMEGIDPAAYDKILELKDYRTVVACAIGYRSIDDKYFHLKKVRFPASQVVVKL